MTEHHHEFGETRLDRLWQAVADEGTESDWLRYYEGFAAQRLIVPMVEGGAAPLTLHLESGEIALGFDTEARFSAFISAPTEHLTLIGAALARALAPLGLGLALNPGVAPGETVLDARAVAWIAEHGGAEVAVGDLPAGTRLQPPSAPEAMLLEALGTRLAEMGGHITEAWLLGAAEADGRETHLCVLRLASGSADVAGEVAADLTRIGQIRATRPFAVVIAKDKTGLLTSARKLGIGLAT